MPTRTDNRERDLAPPTPRRGASLAAALAATAAVALAGCGGSTVTTTSHSKTGGGDSPARIAPNATAGGATGAGSKGSGLAFSKCMRSHGVSNFPDQQANGELNLAGTGINTNSPAFKSAYDACQALSGGGPSPSQQRSVLSSAQSLALAKCMRAHGVSNFPDPNSSGEVPPNEVNLNSPAARKAFQACPPAAGTPSTR